MQRPLVIFITDIARFGELATLSAARTLCSAARPGSVALQLRDTQLGGQERLRLGRQLRQVSTEFGQSLLLNDRLDLAQLCGADGVHLGERSLSPEQVRTWEAGLWISRAWHGAAPEPGADAYLLSPICAQRKGAAPLGLTGLRQHVERYPSLAIYALGGVDASNATACIDAGAAGVAVCADVYRDAHALVQQLGCARG